jgi:hypothetical protein
MARALNFVPLCIALVALVAACGDDTRPPTGGTCSPACATGLTCCGDACVSTTINAQHCGGCGMTCAAGQACSSGVCTGGPTMDGSVVMTDSSVPSMCTPSCSADERCCGTSCFDRTAPTGQLDARTHESFLNCVGCGLSCDPERASRCGIPAMGGPTQCLCGGNLPQCSPGQVCAPVSGTLICVNLSSDPQNCGSVGNVCGEGESCTMGVCGCGFGGAACGDGQSCCGGTCIDTASDPMNCGGCGVVCGAQGPVCSEGACRCGSEPACAPGSGASDIGELCCADTCVPRSATGCTACGEGCSGEDTCGWGTNPLTMMNAVCCGTASPLPIPGFEFICGFEL